MTMAKKCFVTYWPCGRCISGAALDESGEDPETGLMLLDAVRRGCGVGYVDANVLRIGICRCNAQTVTEVQK